MKKLTARRSVSSAPPPGKALALGGAYEGADRFSRELGNYNPPIRSADADMLREKPYADARGRDVVRNDGYAMGATAIHRDSIIGAQYLLNAAPDWKRLGADEVWADEFQQEVESRFTLYAESNDAWIDASRHDSLTGLLRLAITGYVMTGEILASAEWLRGSDRPYSSCVQLIDVDRLCNPNNATDTSVLRGGVERDLFGAAQAFHIRDGYPNDYFNYLINAYSWRRIPARKPWGRLQMLHVYERFRPDQTRGISEMVAVMKQMKMTARFQDIVLQNAVVNASYAATIESELPRDMALEIIGADGKNSAENSTAYLTAIADYNANSKNINLDGVKIPHLFPGTKLQMRPAGTNGGVGTGFEQSLLRHSAAALGLSYEEFSRDFSQTNYSSARAAMSNTWKYMQARKKMVADKFATMIYWLCLEEMINAGDVPMPGKGVSYYEGQNKEAFGKCNWIGASRGQIDELKETQAAVLKMDAGLSSLEQEASKLGLDWRELLAQRAREQKLATQLGVVLNLSTAKPATTAAGADVGEDAPPDTNSPKDTGGAAAHA